MLCYADIVYYAVLCSAVFQAPDATIDDDPRRTSLRPILKYDFKSGLGRITLLLGRHLTISRHTEARTHARPPAYPAGTHSWPG